MKRSTALFVDTNLSLPSQVISKLVNMRKTDLFNYLEKHPTKVNALASRLEMRMNLSIYEIFLSSYQ